MNNQGDINGINLMLNTYMIYKENVMITTDEEEIEKEKKALGENYEIIMSYSGHEVILLRKITPTIGLIYMQSGR